MFRWTDPLTHITVEGTSLDMLLQRAYDERRANSVPTGLEFELEVERDLCQSYPNECQYFDAKTAPHRRLGMGDVIAGTMTILRHKLAGSPLESQEEANRRAAICSTCQFNQHFHKPCARCGDLEDLVRSAMAQGKRTPYDDDLKSCNICACFTKVAVWVPLSVQCPGLTDEQREMFSQIAHCWKKCP
jgi:hypothetical protein